MTGRTRPSSDRVLLGLVRPALEAAGAQVMPLRPDDYLARLPLVEMRDVGGQAGRMVAHSFVAELDVQCWAATREQADDLDDAVLTALRDALRRGTTAADGYLGGLEIVQLGAELRTFDQPGGVYRWQASYRPTIRPARA